MPSLYIKRWLWVTCDGGTPLLSPFPLFPLHLTAFAWMVVSCFTRMSFHESKAEICADNFEDVVSRKEKIRRMQRLHTPPLLVPPACHYM